MGKLDKKKLGKKAVELLPYIIPVVGIIALYASSAYAQGARGLTPAMARVAAPRAQAALAMALARAKRA